METAAEIDNILYQIADMLKTLPPAELQKVLLKLQDALLFEYVYNINFDGVLVQYSTAPFSQNENVKYRELLKQMIEILNKVMPNLMVMKKRRLVNYIINMLKNIALS
ncbi:MAG: hypothetical protein QXX36_03930 [Candidatus Rehaiarchaeum fermentans]|nr:hypothetical protein [Candidatus Rehaiarchaeum fermentans]